MSIIKKEFVRRILADEARRLEKNQGLQMRKLLHFHTGTLEAGRHFSITTPDNADGVLTIKHKAYQRFLDVKKKASMKNGRRVRKKQYPIHNTFVFGHYYSIANRLMVDFTNEVAEGIKREFEGQ